MNFKVVELTKDNEKDYLDQVANLEQVVLKNMEERGQIGQLFPTGKEDISEYAHSKENTVLLAVDDNGKVIAATYITQGQKPFTYNDITKYFKYGEDYNKYVKSTYSSEQEYRKDLLDTYQTKIEAYKYAKSKILEEFPEYNGSMMSFLNHELNEENNRYHEKSVLREKLNVYMSEYIQNKEKENPCLQDKYEKFYWFTSEDIAKEFGKSNIRPQDKDASEFEKIQEQEKEEVEFKKIQENVETESGKRQDREKAEAEFGKRQDQEKAEAEYQNLLKKGPLVIHEKPQFDMKKYYSARTSNSIELDTYITDPNDRREGLARILVLEGIEKHMKRHFENPENQEIFLCSTLHRNNLSSKYVSEFFGLKDNLFVKRRDGRDREVHICRVGRDEFEKYLMHHKKKVAVLYGYNPQNINITKQDELDILKEQLAYERQEAERLKVAKTEQAFNGKIDFEKRKMKKVDDLKERIHSLEMEMKTTEESDNTQKNVVITHKNNDKNKSER